MQLYKSELWAVGFLEEEMFSIIFHEGDNPLELSTSLAIFQKEEDAEDYCDEINSLELPTTYIVRKIKISL